MKSNKERADELEAQLLDELDDPKPGFVERVFLLGSYRWLEEHEDAE